jgi:hypothetical protein
MLLLLVSLTPTTSLLLHQSFTPHQNNFQPSQLPSFTLIQAAGSLAAAAAAG